MNRPVHPAKFFSARQLLATVALALFFQAAGSAVAQNRWLLIFENSAAMKKRMPAVEVALQKLFFTSMDGQMHSGDNLGVWTVDQTLHVGEFPLSIWDSERAVNTASNVVAFLKKRSYKGEVNFNALQPVLGEVVAGSQRLTVLIFCEGQGEIIWTPYNEAINQLVRQNYDERKKNNQPFVILLRVQEGKYFGCTVNFPPGGVNFPGFPELPEEVKPAVAVVTNVPVVRVKKTAPVDRTPLFIIGKTVSTNPPTVSQMIAAEAALTNRPATNPAARVAENQPVPATPTGTNSVTNAVTNALTNAVAPAGNTAPMVAPKFRADGGYQFLTVIGLLALGAALMLAVFLIVRSQRPSGSLITDSMNAPHDPPRRP